MDEFCPVVFAVKSLVESFSFSAAGMLSGLEYMGERTDDLHQ